MNIDSALEKLNSLLPLKKRQKRLSSKIRQSHQNILTSLSKEGRVSPTIEQSMLESLVENDLVVLDANRDFIGAYPFSIRKTAHNIFNDKINLYAMCAFDAVAIAPVFNIKTNIISHCHVTNEKIEISQNANEVVEVKPSSDIHIGIRWQSAGTCAADNLCMEMVFLKDKDTAFKWKDNDEFSVFELKDAIEFSIKYFRPLLEH